LSTLAEHRCAHRGVGREFAAAVVGDGPTPRILRTMAACSSRRREVRTRTLEMLSSEFGVLTA
jgi:hypothetical protein